MSNVSSDEFAKFLEIATELEQNFFFRMSQSSKELFHSNFLSWLFDTYPDRGLIEDVLLPLVKSDLHYETLPKTLRESQKLDLVVFPEGAMPVVIEVKIASELTRSQLERYNNKSILTPNGQSMKVSDCQRIALTLIDPGTVANDAGWAHLPIATLRDNLKTHERVSVARDHWKVIEEYVGLLDVLVKLSDVARSPGLDRPLDSEEVFGLPQFRKEEILARKIRYADFQRLLQLEYGNLGATYSTGYSNGTPLIEAFFDVPAHSVVLGWQYQAGQFRMAIRTKKDPQTGNHPTRVVREEIALSPPLRDWFSQELIDRALEKAKQRGARLGLQWKSGVKGTLYAYQPDFSYVRCDVDDLTPREIVEANRFLAEFLSAMGDD